MSRALAIGCLILVFVPEVAFAGCVEDAIPELRPGTPLTILKTDGTRVRGTFVRAEPSRWTLNATPLYARRNPRRLEIAPSDIGRLEASTPGGVNGKSVFLSMVSGLALGIVVGRLVPVEHHYAYATDAYPPNPGEVLNLDYGERKTLRWGLGGAAVGMITGFAIGHVSGKPHSWTCSDRAPGAAPAVPDSIR